MHQIPDFMGMSDGANFNFGAGQPSSSSSNAPIRTLDSPPMQAKSPAEI